MNQHLSLISAVPMRLALYEHRNLQIAYPYIPPESLNHTPGCQLHRLPSGVV